VKFALDVGTAKSKPAIAIETAPGRPAEGSIRPGHGRLHTRTARGRECHPPFRLPLIQSEMCAIMA
jgi:hypothetical protein